MEESHAGSTSDGVDVKGAHSFIGVNLRPNSPESFNGKRELLVVNTWLYKLDQYFNLIQLAQSNPISDQNKITYASTLLIESTAIWWYTSVQGYNHPKTWNAF